MCVASVEAQCGDAEKDLLHKSVAELAACCVVLAGGCSVSSLKSCVAYMLHVYGLLCCMYIVCCCSVASTQDVLLCLCMWTSCAFCTSLKSVLQ